MKTKTLWLPSAFWNDHAERGLPAGRLIKDTAGKVKITASIETLKEILNDAEYYADTYGPEVWPALKSSAKRTVVAVRAALSECA